MAGNNGITIMQTRKPSGLFHPFRTGNPWHSATQRSEWIENIEGLPIALAQRNDNFASSLFGPMG